MQSNVATALHNNSAIYSSAVKTTDDL